MDKTVIQFDQVTKIYKLFKSDRQRFKALFSKKAKYKEKIAVNDLSFTIRQGESVALFGKNGAGKSTILKMITGVAYPTSGEIRRPSLSRATIMPSGCRSMIVSEP